MYYLEGHTQQVCGPSYSSILYYLPPRSANCSLVEMCVLTCSADQWESFGVPLSHLLGCSKVREGIGWRPFCCRYTISSVRHEGSSCLCVAPVSITLLWKSASIVPITAALHFDPLGSKTHFFFHPIYV